MYFENWAEFFTMGGHGTYVWSAYALAFLVMTYNLLAPFLAHRRTVNEIRRLHRITTTQPSGAAEVMNESGS